MITAPKRRFELEIKISGDRWEDVTADLRDLAAHVEDHGPACTSVSGGYASGHIVTVTESPEQTHEKYVADLGQYLARTRGQELEPKRKPVCKTCNDTHSVYSERRERDIMCTSCPVPCDRCRAGGNGPYCEETPCGCSCHSGAVSTRLASYDANGSPVDR